MTKTVNYTLEQEAQIVDQYQAGMTIDEIGTMLGKSTKSVVALPPEGVTLTEIEPLCRATV